MLRLQQDDELSGNKSPSLSGPAGYFWRKSIFKHGDHISKVAGCDLWMVDQVGKIDEIIFLEYWVKSIYRS